ncbi:MAG: carboxypeptidase-like regulatory domain-containing protein, partial [Muribaculaceae bacterium]|nr:carboxypeptidase-like regulatory domain-containing protein [Muribaculaceae bacterium]
MTRLRSIPVIYWGEQVLKILVNGYVATGKKSKIDLGPVNTLISYNHLEGVRLRVGGVTTADLSPHWFGRGYIAYGFKDRKFKYDAEIEYSFLPKKVHAREFPVHLLRARYKYELDMIGQRYFFTNQDNVFLSLKRHQSDLGLYKRDGAIDYELEMTNNLSVMASLDHYTYHATPWLPFVNGAGTNINHYSVSQIAVTLRYAPGERFVQARSYRTPVNLDAPIFTLTQRLAIRHWLNTDFNVNITEASIFKRIWLSAFGYLDVLLKGGKIWSRVQYPELLWPNANLSYTIQPESYSLMNPMEFAMDYYGSLDLTYWMNGLIFNRIPLLKKLKCREVIGYKMLMGGLTRKNNPEFNPELFRFPADAGVTRMTSTPYMELSAGIDNILTILRLDYVW